MEDKYIKLIKAVKEFNIGMGTMVDFLEKKGYKVDKHPMAKLTSEMYQLLLTEFSTSERLINSNSKQQSNDAANGISSGESHAIQLIYNCIKLKAPDLDLGRCGLTSIDFEVGSIIDKELRKCKHITSLILSNEYKQHENIKIESFNIGEPNFLTQLPKAVSQLKDLKTLICCGDFEKKWKIKDISALVQLKKLTYLDLSYNEIDSIIGLKNLSSLETIIIHRNNIRFIDHLLNLKNLHSLDLHANKIEIMPDIKSETNIVILNLHSNSIERIRGISKYIRLKELDISNNNLTNFEGFEPLLELDIDEPFRLKIDTNPILKEYQLKLLSNENHFPFIKEILQRQLDQSTRREIIYPAKILLFGNHSAGKSTIVNYLTEIEETGSTHILRIVNYNFKDKKDKILSDAILFDFGGQDFYHGVYRAFISEGAIQIIVFNTKTDKNEISTDTQLIPIVNYNRRYWLGQKSFQEHKSNLIADFIIVQTHTDTDSEASQEDYSLCPGYKKSFSIAFDQDDEKFDQIDKDFFTAGRHFFKTYLNSLISKYHETFNEPKWYVDFLLYIFQKKDKGYDATAIDDVLAHYKVRDLSEQAKRESLITNLTLLHRHGLVLYYNHINGLEDFVWLNPEKLVRHIQEDILSPVFANPRQYIYSGIISREEFENIVTDKRIVLLLKEQQVIFLHKPTENEANDEYIIPNYLPLVDDSDTSTQLFTFGLNTPNFIIKFENYIPFGLINQMICFYGKQPDYKKFWRNQLLFTLNKELRVLIKLDFESLMIKVYLQCLSICSYSINLIYEYLFFSIIDLYWNFNSSDILSFNEFIEYKEGKETEKSKLKNKIWMNNRTEMNCIPEDAYISIDGKQFVNYAELLFLKSENYKIPSYRIQNNKIDWKNATEIPVSPFQPFTYINLPIMKKIFVSYSKFDEDYLQDFEDHLITLKQEGVATFNCQRIEFGKEWDSEIKRQLDESDIMVCLISVKFLNTDYITSIEIPRAIEQNKMIIPIIIKPCDWENSALGKFQAAQRGKVVAMDNGKRLFGEIRAQTREERDAFWTDVIKEFRKKISFQ